MIFHKNDQLSRDACETSTFPYFLPRFNRFYGIPVEPVLFHTFYFFFFKKKKPPLHNSPFTTSLHNPPSSTTPSTTHLDNPPQQPTLRTSLDNHLNKHPPLLTPPRFGRSLGPCHLFSSKPLLLLLVRDRAGWRLPERSLRCVTGKVMVHMVAKGLNCFLECWQCQGGILEKSSWWHVHKCQRNDQSGTSNRDRIQTLKESSFD